MKENDNFINTFFLVKYYGFTKFWPTYIFIHRYQTQQRLLLRTYVKLMQTTEKKSLKSYFAWSLWQTLWNQRFIWITAKKIIILWIKFSFSSENVCQFILKPNRDQKLWIQVVLCFFQTRRCKVELTLPCQTNSSNRQVFDTVKKFDEWSLRTKVKKQIFFFSN